MSKTLPGVEPLNKIADDNKIFPAGVSFTKGWFFQVKVKAFSLHTNE